MNSKRNKDVTLSDNLIPSPTDQSLPVTPDNNQPLKRELHVLNSGTREQSYVHKDSGNRIIHWDSLKSLIQTNLVCRKCGSDIVLKEYTVGIATKVELTCKKM